MNYEVTPLTDVMNTLLGENGCPWDKEQTHQSLRKTEKMHKFASEGTIGRLMRGRSPQIE